MTKKIVFRAIKLIWIILCLAALAWALSATDGNSEYAGMIIFGSMIVLTFPIGVLVVNVISLLYHVFNIEIIPWETIQGSSPGTAPSPIFLWAYLFVAGYFQWFIFLPFCVRIVQVAVRKVRDYRRPK